MKYLVFEAGSRAGFSAEMFFLDYLLQSGSKDDQLVLADQDASYISISTNHPQVERIDEHQAFYRLFDNEPFIIFPGDELTRQSQDLVRHYAYRSKWSEIETYFYDKAFVNNLLADLQPGGILIPKTFSASQIFLRPNIESAGSKGLDRKFDYCATEYIDIIREYVVDCIMVDGNLSIYPREVVLRSGYDKLIKLLPTNGRVAEKVQQFSCGIYGRLAKMFDGVFHLQLAENEDGNLYFIEASKRISGSAVCNLFRGFNPFYAIANVQPSNPLPNPFAEGEWYRWEDFVTALNPLRK